MIIFEDKFEVNYDTVVTLGKFDGLHEGHKKLIDMVIRKAKKNNYKSLVYTFNQNPLEILENKKIEVLMTKNEKISALENMGIDYLIFQDFTCEFSNMDDEVFAREIIKKKLKAKMVVVGDNYRFGREGRGNVEALKKYGKKYGFEVCSITLLLKKGEIISSSSIRKKLAAQVEKECL